MSKIETGRINLNTNKFDLYRLLNDLEELLKLKASDKGLQLIFEHSNQVPRYVCTDEIKLRQVLINLLNKAIKFTTSGGFVLRVQVNRRENTSYVLGFEIENTGVGIPEAEI